MVQRSLSILAASALILGTEVASFVPQQTSGSAVKHTSIRSTQDEQDMSPVVKEEEETVLYNVLSEEGPSQQPLSDGWAPNARVIAPINGWVPKEDYACWGLPGALAPTGFFDPIGFAQRGTPLNDVKRLREAEVMHGRVAMLATVGYLAGEAISGPFGITGPANDQLQQVPLPAFAFLSISIAAAELYRAKVGWVEPKAEIGSNTLWTLRDTYYPGDIGFDPLGLKPTTDYEFQVMQTKELQNGRLAMLGWAGMCSQELVNHKPILETLNFYRMVFSGEYDPYYY